MEYPGFIGGSSPSQVPVADNEATVNWLYEKLPSGKAVLTPTPGFELLTTLTTGPVRGAIQAFGRHFVVSGTKLYEISKFGVATDRGTVAIDDNPATIRSNGDGGGQLFITSGTNGYCYDVDTNVLTQVTAMDGLCTMCEFLDGYFIVLNKANSTFYLSTLFDGLTWSPGTQFAQRSTAADPWVSMAVSNKLLYMIGNETGDIWYNAGNFPFPFALVSTSLFNYGCAATFSPAVAGSTLFWVGRTAQGSGLVLASEAYNPTSISTYALEHEFEKYNLEDAISDSYDEAGHNHYRLTFKQSEKSWNFDASSKRWTQIGLWDNASASFLALRVSFHAFVYGEHRVGDWKTGKVYKQAISYGTDVDGLAMRRLRRAPVLSSENRRLFFKSFELDIETGLGNTVAPSDNPQAMMRFSDDGGKTWSTEMMRSTGKRGEYGTRVRWWRLGSGIKRVFEVAVSDTTPQRLIGAYLDTTPSLDGRSR